MKDESTSNPDGGWMITFASYSDTGSRPVNEDSIGVFEKNGYSLFVCCDGLGGHGMGDTASRLVVQSFQETFDQFYDDQDFLKKGMELAQSALLAEQRRLNAGRKMKTTVTVLLIGNGNAQIAHIGDSRVYTFWKTKVKTRTLDHSVPQMLVLTRQLKEKEIRNHPDRSLVLHVMGSPWGDETPYEIAAPISLRLGHAFLLCTDGFWELIDEKEMCRQMKASASVQEWLFRMREIVKQNGAGTEMDNNSAIAVWNR